jgi:hypothetical protein
MNLFSLSLNTYDMLESTETEFTSRSVKESSHLLMTTTLAAKSEVLIPIQAFVKVTLQPPQLKKSIIINFSFFSLDTKTGNESI